MGVPYSKEIQTAGETAKKFSILLAAIQVVNVIILALILLALLALLVTLNADLEDERAAVVTPAVKWIIQRLWNVVPATHPRRRDVELPRAADTLKERRDPQVTTHRRSS